MQQFTVPQFIDVEDKVIGPITVRQFIIILVAAGLIVVCHQIFYLTTALVLTVIISFITVIVAFVKVNGVHFHLFLTNQQALGNQIQKLYFANYHPRHL